LARKKQDNDGKVQKFKYIDIRKIMKKWSILLLSLKNCYTMCVHLSCASVSGLRYCDWVSISLKSI